MEKKIEALEKKIAYLEGMAERHEKAVRALAESQNVTQQMFLTMAQSIDGQNAKIASLGSTGLITPDGRPILKQ